MNDLKITITRSFARTIQIKQYSPANFFCSLQRELPADATPELVQTTSKELWEFCKSEVERDAKEYTESMFKLVEGEDSPF
jgi:hypothetical protein